MKLTNLLGFSKRWSLFLAIAALLTVRVMADDLPSFADPAVNTFVKEYSDFVTQYQDAYKAAKAGDSSKLQPLQQKVQELNSEAASLGTKVKPDEQQKFQTFIAAQSQKILDTLNQK